MLDYIESLSNNGLPNEAIDFIFEILLTSRPLNEFHQIHRDSLVVQIDEVFSGTSGGGEQWQIEFTIDIDARSDRQGPHVGYTINRIHNVRNITEPRQTGHVYLPDNMEIIGRPQPGLQGSLLTKVLVCETKLGKMLHQCYVSFFKIDPRRKQ